MLSSLTDRERRPIRIEFLTLQGKPNGFTHATFSLSFRHVDQANPPRLQSTATLHPHVALILDFIQKRVEIKSTRGSNQVLKLTDYHISRYVVSTFKSLTNVLHTAALTSFYYTDGVSTINLNHCKHQPLSPPVILMISMCGSKPEPISRE